MAEIMKYADLWYVTLRGLLEIYLHCMFVPRIWRQHKSPKRRYMATKFHGVTSQKPAAVRFFISLFTIFDQLVSFRQCFALQYPLMSLTVPFYTD